MTSPILQRIVEGAVAPRRSAAWLLAQKPGVDAVVAMVVLAYLVQALAILVIPGARPEDPPSPIAWHLAGLVFQGLTFLGTSGLVLWIGRIFGGTASLPQTLALMAWYGLVTSFLSPLALAAWGMAPQGGAAPAGGLATLLLLAVVAIAIRMFGGFVAELHGFRNSWTVVAVTVGLVLGASVVLSGLVPSG